MQATAVDVKHGRGIVAEIMLRLLPRAVCFAVGLVWHTSVRAEAVLPPDNPYATIVMRNLFGLTAPQPVVETALPVAPKETITPNGIMSLFGQLQVLFKVTGAVKAGQPAKEAAYILSQGQQQDGIEVVRINEAASLVTFNNHGVVQEIPLPDAPKSGAAKPALSEDHPPSFRRPEHVGMIGTGRMPPYLGGGEENAGQGALAPMTPEQQVLMIEAQRAYYKSHNDPRASTLPPTAMTPTDAFDPPAENPTAPPPSLASPVLE